jgi:transposase
VDIRHQKARELADRGRVVKEGDGRWLVFSLNSANRYRVTLNPPSCDCEDFTLRQEACKHVIAVRSVATRESLDIPLPPPTEEPPVQRPRKTYAQDWPAYDAAQTGEKREFRVLLAELCSGLPEPPRKPGAGRPPTPIADQAFAACFKVFTGFSGRRFMTDLQEAASAGYVTQPIAHCGIARFLEREDTFELLRGMVQRSALPLAALESQFAVDSSGFSACKFDRWYDAKYGRMHQEHSWVKTHIMTGTLTHAVTAVEIRDKDAFDSPLLPPLVKVTAVGFKIGEVSGDKAYATVENFDTVAAAGGTPYIAFKTSHTGAAGGLWERMYHLFCLRKEDYLRHYHRRSNVESTFSMVKRKFGDSVRSKTETAMRNEVLAKLVCHNVSCVIHAAHEFGIKADFETREESDSKFILKFPI